MIELVAHGLLSGDKRIVALLTDLNNYYEFFWFEKIGSYKYIKSSQIFQSAAEARVIINGLLTGGAADRIGKRCPIPLGDLPPIIEGESGGDYEDSKDDANDDSDKSGEKKSNGKGKKGKQPAKGPQKSTPNSNPTGQSQGMANFSLDESLPGANLLSFIGGNDPAEDLDAAREYAWGYFKTHAPTAGAVSKRPALREINSMQLTAENLELSQVGLPLRRAKFSS